VLRDNVYGTIEEDAVRRDFTANALYYAIEDFSVRDYVGGFEDVRSALLRLIGDPERAIAKDPVRMLRAVRLAAKLDFRIEPATAAPIPALAPLLREAAPARLFEECLKLFLVRPRGREFRGLERHGLLPVFLPETAAALQSNRSGALRRMLIEGLRSTDARVANDEPVSPAFLFAVLLWPAYCRDLMQLQAQGVHAAEAQRAPPTASPCTSSTRSRCRAGSRCRCRRSGCCSRASRSASASACSACCRIRVSARRSISCSCAMSRSTNTPKTSRSGARCRPAGRDARRAARRAGIDSGRRRGAAASSPSPASAPCRRQQ
jgi:tRNA nucleotidyltransferase/poly(A) polymerase